MNDKFENNETSYIVTVLKPSKDVINYIDKVRERLKSDGLADFLGQNAIGAHCTLTVHTLSDNHYKEFVSLIDSHVKNIGVKHSQLLGLSSFVGAKNLGVNVLYLSLLIKSDLLGCQKSLYKLLSKFDEYIYSDYVKVDQWAPHMTIHPNLNDEQLKMALGYALEVWQEMGFENNKPFQFEALEIYSFNKNNDNKVTLKNTRSWDLI
tara:strand:+ start:482 stop:1102 length:621 start_codon:yes stop_codon:yes gene_type:complete